jgi:hypothetical protein
MLHASVRLECHFLQNDSCTASFSGQFERFKPKRRIRLQYESNLREIVERVEFNAVALTPWAMESDKDKLIASNKTLPGLSG